MIGIKLRKNFFEHPKHAEIIAAIKAKEKWDWINAEYKCGLATISRYKKKIKLLEEAGQLIPSSSSPPQS